MKLNNRGWGLQMMMVCVLILMICLVVVAALVNKNFKELTNGASGNTSSNPFNYTKLESRVEEATKNYVKLKDIKLDEDDTYTVTIEKLQSEELLDEIKDNTTKCTGYSVVSNKSNNLTYKAYIKCGSNYQTKNYSK